MTQIKQRLVESIARRLQAEVSNQNPVKFLLNHEVEEMIDTTISVVYLYTRLTRNTTKTMASFAEVVSAIGHGVRNKFKLKRDSALAAKAGAFLLYTLEAAEIIKVVLSKGANNHATYAVSVKDEEILLRLWETISVEKTEKLPSLTPYEPWTSSRHATGQPLVKTSNAEVLAKLTPKSHPIVFATVNKAQAMGWRLNEEVMLLQQWALRNKTDAFSDIWELQDPIAKQSKLREAKAINGIALRFIDKTFYHLYYLDFRGRKYPATAYLHEQGSDVAKGLLCANKFVELTEQGFFWLMIVIASNWANDAGREDGYKTDKIPLNDRVNWALDNEEILLSYANSPKVNQGWMKADKPWQFLAACIELRNFRAWQEQECMEHTSDEWHEIKYTYLTNFYGFIDGSNNGSQHLSALTKDEVTAPHVNLVPLPFPGDLYRYVGDHVWSRLEEMKNEMTQEQIKESNRAIDELFEIKTKIYEAEMKSENRKELVDEIREFRLKNEEALERGAILYWLRIIDSKHKRKIVKRNVMTLPYGGSAYGLGNQQMSDARKHGIDLLILLEHKWASFMGRAVFDDAKISLKRPMQLLSVFEQAGKVAETENTFLGWTVPITNFPVVQNYTNGEVKKVWIQYGPPEGQRLSTTRYINTLQVNICFLECPVYAKKRQSQGASPNAIHSLDAAHLMLTVAKADFDMVTVHDSFGSLLPDLPELFILVRETFVELYEANPLDQLMKDIKGDLTDVEIGTLDVREILDSEYAFV